MAKAGSTEKVVREIRRHTRRRFSAEEKIRIVLEGLRGEESIAALCGVGARMRAGRRASNRRARHLPMRYETGLPSSVIRFRT